MKTLTPGTYVIRYSIGVGTIPVSMGRTNFLQAYNQTIQKFSNVEPIGDKIKEEWNWITGTGMLLKIYIKVISPLDLEKWNKQFLNNLRGVFGLLETWGQWLSFEYSSYSEISPEKAKQRSERETWWDWISSEIFSPTGTWALWAIAVGIGIYVLTTSLTSKTMEE